jgi:amino-acid N-acetyltransferase
LGAFRATTMNHREANITDFLVIKELLNHSNLPSNDIEKYIENFIIIEINNKIIGIGGLETYNQFGLIRSIVVKPECRNNGVAKNIYGLIEKKASDSGIKTLYLLTETAIDYFKKLGFKIQSRSNVPKSIMRTKQFRELCPSSAVVMFRDISNLSGLCKGKQYSRTCKRV